jgi:hypothetical protein
MNKGYIKINTMRSAVEKERNILAMQMRAMMICTSIGGRIDPENIDRAIDEFLDSVLERYERIDLRDCGQITSYFYRYDPTMTNFPTSGWTTARDRERHLDERLRIWTPIRDGGSRKTAVFTAGGQ